MERLAKTGFYISVVSYGMFWVLDTLRPGFVARSFSVHLFLLAALVFGVWWGIIMKEYTDRPWLQLAVAAVLGILLAVLTWNFGEGLGALRLLIAAFAVLIPVFVWQLIR